MLQCLDSGTLAMLPGMGERAYCIVSGHRIIGSAIIAEHGETAYLWGMYVLLEHQRSGAGSQLMAAIAAGITASKQVEVRVLTSSSWAKEFYVKQGFRLVGEEMTEIMGGISMATSVLAADVTHLKELIRFPG
jgi:ribosomal protein S18 acetylase RimI-like enzyme